jgi:hypothetical protein
MNSYKWRNPTPAWVEVYSFDNYKDTSLTKYANLYSDEIKAVVTHFMEWTDGPTMVWSAFKSNPVEGARVELRQADFANGTVRLRHSAHYVLMEDIVFEPNPNDDFLPTPAQTAGGASAEYPTAPFGGYHLGFFAAITVESKDIFLDLNGKILRQSPVFELQQRFYANIELASTPFIPNQGPANFGDLITSADTCLITNGTLGLSSHHGIHGNSMKKVIIQNLNIVEFEVAGIALNGGEHCLTRNVNICNMSRTIPVLSTYSAGRFIQPFLKQIIVAQPSAALEFTSGGITTTKTGEQILNNLVAEMNTVLDAVKANQPVPDGIFKNSSGLYDGGGYGIVINSRGVVVNGFKTSRVGAVGNEDIIIHNVQIENMETGQGEIIGISNANDPNHDPSAYGGKVQVGPVGSVFQVLVASTAGAYMGNVVSDAKLFVAKFSPGSGTVNITDPIIDWALSGADDLEQVLLDNNYYFVSGGDSMAHVMKGIIGLFVSAGKDVKCFDMQIRNIKNASLPGANSTEKTDSKAAIVPLKTEYNGGASRGIAIVGSEQVFIKNINVDSIKAECGNSCGLDLINECSNIRAREKIEISGIESSAIVNTGKAPNPKSKPLFIEISDESTSKIEIK